MSHSRANSLITQRLTFSTLNLNSALASTHTINSLAFANTLITRTRFPYRNPVPDGCSIVPPSEVAKYVTRLYNDPTFRMVVVRDLTLSVAGGREGEGEGGRKEEGEIISVATFNVFRSQEELVRWLDEKSRKDGPEGDGEHVEASREFRNMIIKSKRDHLVGEGKGGAIVLDSLATHPKYQRRGAGKMLVDWGTKIADDMRLPMYLEASLQGEPVYQRCGFEHVGVWRWDVRRFEKAERLPENGVGKINVEEGDDLVELGLMIRYPVEFGDFNPEWFYFRHLRGLEREE